MSRQYVLTERDYQRLSRLVKAYEAGELKPRGERQQIGLPRDKSVVRVTNASGATLEKGSVVELTEYELGDNELQEDNFWFTADESTGKANWGVLLHSVANEMDGTAQVMGACMALVNITNTAHTHAGVKSGETVLESADSGPVLLLAHNGEEEEQLCPVVIDRSGGEASAYGFGRVHASSGSHDMGMPGAGAQHDLTLVGSFTPAWQWRHNTTLITHDSKELLRVDQSGLWSVTCHGALRASNAANASYIGLNVVAYNLSATTLGGGNMPGSRRVNTNTRSSQEHITIHDLFPMVAGDAFGVQVTASADTLQTVGDVEWSDVFLRCHLVTDRHRNPNE